MDAPRLSPGLADAINAHLETLKAINHAGSHVHAQYLVDAWASFVDEVRTYSLSIYDYTNDLDARNMLEAAAEAIGPTPREQLLELLIPLDTQFMANTQPVRRSFRPQEEFSKLAPDEQARFIELARDGMAAVQNADAEFRTEVEAYLAQLRSQGSVEPRPWNSRIPLDPGEELLEDLKSDGYL
jgi:hypothetical protein